MKNYLLLVSLLAILMTSCEHGVGLEDTVLFSTNSGLEYKFSDFELYDSSTHIFYFRSSHPEFKASKSSTFSVLLEGDEIYKGVFHPDYSSTLPNGHFISSGFSLYSDYFFRMGFMSPNPETRDRRNDPGLIEALKDHNLLHSGLSGQIKDIIVNGTRLTFSFTVKNCDNSDLLILDPEKTGPKLFHYFTNAPVFYNMTQNKVFAYNTDFLQPSPWDKWDMTWLSCLKPGDSRDFTFDYTINTQLTPGKYRVFYQFPGFSYQIPLNQLFQGSARIWLGDIDLIKDYVF